MATYVNNLRLKEIATGDESGTVRSRWYSVAGVKGPYRAVTLTLLTVPLSSVMSSVHSSSVAVACTLW